ncbi:hypothetical protein B5V00_00100 [Geothermobacter hydrogeniphilus]|uniref:Radical SAM enzyme, TIGR03279 family n=2 Tax=Geothermobacter hydrogeniphilus TaxID=1969733 RepID=A0A1X0YDM8_9BACT|nr:hypothetical protein B5V00_00100 [Geothermobacter hydrogeniphilus]
MGSMLEIIAVHPESVGRELDIEAGDFLLEVNGHAIRDLIDARFYLADSPLLLQIEKADGDLWELEIELGVEDDLGLEFAHPEPSRCGNNCQFCYVHQLPRGLRSTLYIKDEDYRFSFLYGAYVTLANLAESDLRRILEQRLSPLYVSVHAVTPEIRNRLLGKQAPPVLPLLKKLVSGGITLHTQIVLCPGINDGAVLQESISALADLRPGIASLAVVPVGLTGHRQALPTLRTPSRVEAERVLDLIEDRQRQFRTDGGRFVFAADEFYLKAQRPLPSAEHYEGFPQLENGIGLIAVFRQGTKAALRDAAGLPPFRLTTITGHSFHSELQAFADQLAACSEVELQVLAVPSRLFGGEISVAGLICGEDILSHLRGVDLGAGLLLPDIVLRDGSEQLLDDLSPAELSVRLGCPVTVIDSTAPGLVAGIRSFLSGENL